MIEEFNIAPPDMNLQAGLQQKMDGKTKPVGALGRLEEVALQIGLIRQSLSPVLRKPVAAIFAGDHGIAAEEPVSAYPQEVSAQMVQNYLQGGAAVNVFCRLHGLAPRIIDAGVAADIKPDPHLIDLKIAKGTRNYTEQPAMSRGQCLQALKSGAALADRWHSEGTNVIAFGEMGIGNTASASVLTSLFSGLPVEQCTGKGTGLNNEGVARKTEILRRAIEFHEINNEDTLAVLSTFGGFEIAMMTGAMLKAAEHQMVLLIDGFISTAAFLAGHQLHSAIKAYALFGHESGEAGHQLQLDFLDVRALLQLDMRLGEGTGAVLAWPLVQSAVQFLNEMASFGEAGVSKGGIG